MHYGIALNSIKIFVVYFVLFTSSFELSIQIMRFSIILCLAENTLNVSAKF